MFFKLELTNEAQGPFYRKNFHSPAIVKEDFELRLTDGIAVVYSQPEIPEETLLLKSKVKLSEVVAGAMTLGLIHSLYESMMRTNKNCQKR